MSEKVYWTPLESSPETMDKLVKDIGVKGIHCEDIFGFDNDSINFMSGIPCAVILCFPEYKKAEELVKPFYDELKAKDYKNPDKIFFMKQKIGNACGTFALLHSISNNRDKLDIGDGAFYHWFQKALPLDVQDRSKCLETDAEMARHHEASARSGETGVADEPVEHHFITFVNVDGTLFEVDSSMDFARPVGPTSPATFVSDVGKVVEQLVKGLDSISFNAIAVCLNN